MIKNEDKIKSVEQFLNIVFNNQDDIDEFYYNFDLQTEGEYKEDNNHWWCRFTSNIYATKEIEVGFNDDGVSYGGEINGHECGEYDFGIDGEWDRGGIYNSIWDSKYKSKKTFYKKIRESFLNIVEAIKQAEQEDIELYQDRLEDGSERYFDKSYDELTENQKNELQWNLDGEDTYNMMVKEGWIDED